MRYLTQTEMNGYYCCRLIAVLNACRWYGRETIPATGPHWQSLVDDCGCRFDDNLIPHEIYEQLGIKPIAIPNMYTLVERNVPAMIPIEHCEEFAHWALVVRAEDGIVDIANYKGHLDPTTPVHTRPWDRLKFRKLQVAYALENINDDGIYNGIHG